MKSQKKYLFKILAGIFFLISCVKKECQITGTYEFQLPVTLSPALDTFKIGDTVTIKIDFSDNVYDSKTNEYYYLENFRFHPATSVFRIDTIPPYGDDLYSLIETDFDILIDTNMYEYNIFQYSNGSSALIGQYLYEDERYKLIFRLIPKISGLYTMRHIHRVSTYEGYQSFEGKCKNIISEAQTVLNSDSDNNIDFLKSPREYWNTWVLQQPKERFYDSGGYVFYVIE